MLFVIGIALCVKGSDLFVSAAKWLGDVSGISKAVIGSTIVAFSTSAPELFVSLLATLRGYSDMGMANIVGSNAVNIGIGLAAIAIIGSGKVGDPLSLMRGVVLVVSTVMLFAFAFFGTISWVHGIFFAILMMLYIYYNIKHCKEEKAPRLKTNAKQTTKNVLLFIVGLAGVLFGAHLIVQNASFLAASWGMSEALVGLTIVAVGTSLPEISTSIASIIKKERGLAIGNIIGSCIFNIAAILAIVTFSAGNIEVSQSMSRIDIPVLLALTLLAIIPTAITKRVHKWQGVALAVVYMGFLVFTIVSN